MSKPQWEDWGPIEETRFGPPGYPYWGVGCIWSDFGSLDHKRTRDMVIRSVNTLGPHLDDAERMAAFEAIAGMDADTFGVFMDRMKEVGFLGGEG